jgi:hypothetical protein
MVVIAKLIMNVSQLHAVVQINVSLTAFLIKPRVTFYTTAMARIAPIASHCILTQVVYAIHNAALLKLEVHF